MNGERFLGLTCFLCWVQLQKCQKFFATFLSFSNFFKKKWPKTKLWGQKSFLNKRKTMQHKVPFDSSRRGEHEYEVKSAIFAAFFDVQKRVWKVFEVAKPLLKRILPFFAVFKSSQNVQIRALLIETVLKTPNTPHFGLILALFWHVLHCGQHHRFDTNTNHTTHQFFLPLVKRHVLYSHPEGPVRWSDVGRVEVERNLFRWTMDCSCSLSWNRVAGALHIL